MRTSFHHQPEAQHPIFQLSTSWQADYPIFRGEADMRCRVLDALQRVRPGPDMNGLKSRGAAVPWRTVLRYCLGGSAPRSQVNCGSVSGAAI